MDGLQFFFRRATNQELRQTALRIGRRSLAGHVSIQAALEMIRQFSVDFFIPPNCLRRGRGAFCAVMGASYLGKRRRCLARALSEKSAKELLGSQVRCIKNQQEEQGSSYGYALFVCGEAQTMELSKL